MLIIPLKPCPFCGSQALSVENLGSNERRFFAVACGNCEADGPLGRTARHASEAWNTRTEAKKADGE